MEKKTIEEYLEIIQEKKVEANHKEWLYIELNAQELLDETEPKVNNLTAVCKAMLEAMLEGDIFLAEPKVKSRIGKVLSVRYYCDNLSPARRKYSEVNG